MQRVFVVGDIHGCFNTLENLLFEKCCITKYDRLILLGDIIDRGPRIKETLHFIVDLIRQGYDIITIRGNHEQYMIDTLVNPKYLKNWFKNGGQSTLDSFCVINPGFIDDEIVDYIFNTKYYHIEDNYLCVHGGLNFNISDPLEDKHAMLTSRNNYNMAHKINKLNMIVGHTPTPIEQIKLTLNTNLIKLDGGCVYHKRVKGLGHLVAFELKSKQLFYTVNLEN